MKRSLRKLGGDAGKAPQPMAAADSISNDTDARPTLKSRKSFRDLVPKRSPPKQHEEKASLKDESSAKDTIVATESKPPPGAQDGASTSPQRLQRNSPSSKSFRNMLFGKKDPRSDHAPSADANAARDEAPLPSALSMAATHNDSDPASTPSATLTMDKNAAESDRQPLHRVRKDAGSAVLRKVTPQNQPEVHLLGDLVGGSGFEAGVGYVCKWRVDYGEAWQHVCGKEVGQTHVDTPSTGDDVIWAHPIDVLWTTFSMQGWPRLLVQVWTVDEHGGAHVCGYGFSHVPSSPGHHLVTIGLWRPLGSEHQELAALFLGQTTELLCDDVVFNSAWADRCRLRTIASGQVHFELHVILRHFAVEAFRF
ncbi:hypothetical protein SPRG_00420 [Saprolegnia parasitica CBS 223.65]|uniref:B9 domain-containing protein 2 n=1 Tax=Saprolegnia parasitica (strain CBS 223.65) TaxID=695850 RepID=A0A067CYK2_SAPPC|nr:hypothetical protein SPRG_00420 [Saprolegnia parasitica CBS 223.65]KDO35578.1 hypothetical protein SPRG_00420 [Saprolegnia parasitica CBS 223.65]|eukprot:XP_012193909.1 hypothetical protein SPRG_00420 [Saprolegnia parasitica CBS 223.65]